MTQKIYSTAQVYSAEQKEADFVWNLCHSMMGFQRDYQRSGMTFNEYFNSMLREGVPKRKQKASMAEAGRDLRKMFNGIHKANRILGSNAHPLLREAAAKFKGTKPDEFLKFKPVFKKIMSLENLDADMLFYKTIAELQEEKNQRFRNRIPIPR